MTQSTLNGSVGKLAEAFRDMFNEALEPVRADISAVKADISVLNENMVEMESRIYTHIDERVGTVAENVQTQLAAHRKEVSADVRKIVRQAPKKRS